MIRMQSSFVSCLGSSAFPIVDLTLHGQFIRSPCRDSLACLGSYPNVGTRKGSTVEVVLPSCRYCSSRPCLLFCPFETRSLQQRWLCKKYQFGTASFCHGLNMVLNRDCTVVFILLLWFLFFCFLQCKPVKLRGCRQPPVFPR